ncbi:MAG: sigma-54-dependent Fis family transcriptional regulator [bacterium]|nr:sigma-54-dependent Fis family transcriptional regulator [bacterium]
MATILIVDDEQVLVQGMELQLSEAGHECFSAHTLTRAREILTELDPELALIDIHLPDGSGMDLIRSIRAEDRRFPIVVVTAFGSIPNAVSAMREGANDYIVKPVDLDALNLIVEHNLETQHLRGRVELYERLRREEADDDRIVGKSKVFTEAMEMVRSVADPPGAGSATTMAAVLITGETGTGKDLLARHVHNIGPLAAQPFVDVDCAALPRELIESELFGHERGAFTDAKNSKRGLLEIAAGGTIFLNEIGELPVELQARLLSLLEGKSFRRVGGTRRIEMNVRIIAATNSDLQERVAAKTFRRDLFYRLNVFHIHLPPLRERGQDTLLLVEHFVGRLCRKYCRPPAVLSEEAQALLTKYPWPGNVRELVHVIERAALLHEDGLIGTEHLGMAPTHAPVSIFGTTLPELERRLIRETMEHTEGNVSEAARILGISRDSLRHRLAGMDKT